jgi:fatty acid desaturase
MVKTVSHFPEEKAMAARRIVSTLVPHATLKPLMMTSNGPAGAHLAAHLLLIAVLASLVGAAQDHLLVWPAMFCLGIVLTHLFAPQHECAHYSAFKSRRTNEFVASVCGAIVMVPEIHFRYEHTNHHRYTNLTGQDSQFIPLPQSLFGYGWYLSGLPYWWGSVSGIAKRSLGRLSEAELGFIPAAERATVIWEARAHALLYLSLALAGLWAGPPPSTTGCCRCCWASRSCALFEWLNTWADRPSSICCAIRAAHKSGLSGVSWPGT